MKSSILLVSLMLGSVLVACGDPGEDTRSVGRGIEGSACQTDSDCALGLECELEHGESFCKPHGGDDGDDGSGGDDGAGGSDGSGATAGNVCATDADCGAGMECELEHGESFCKPHGGSDD